VPAPIRFALNHMAAPGLGVAEFFRLAESLGVTEVEIRNDLPGRATADGTPPEAVRHAASEARVAIVSINALQRFDQWSPERETEAMDLASYARRAGARGLVLVPTNDGGHGDLASALARLGPILADHDLVGLVEPLGFTTCSLRFKRRAAEAIVAVGGGRRFRLVHDTFHHAVAGEPELFPDLTGLVHLSGVSHRAVPVAGLADGHRGLIDEDDRIDNLGQIERLLAAGYRGPFSFEPFATDVHQLRDPAQAIGRSMDFIRRRLARTAAIGG